MLGDSGFATSILLVHEPVTELAFSVVQFSDNCDGLVLATCPVKLVIRGAGSATIMVSCGVAVSDVPSTMAVTISVNRVVSLMVSGGSLSPG